MGADGRSLDCAFVRLCKFPTVFNGLGKISGEPVHIVTEEGATPYHITAARKVPLPLLKSYRKRLNGWRNWV